MFLLYCNNPNLQSGLRAGAKKIKKRERVRKGLDRSQVIIVPTKTPYPSPEYMFLHLTEDLIKMPFKLIINPN